MTQTIVNSLDEMVEEAARTLGVEIPEEMPEEEQNDKNGKPISKSQRVRDYLEANPEARNKDVAADLEPYGVRPADVANTKAIMKKKEAKKAKKRAAAAGKAALADKSDSAVGSAASGPAASGVMPEIEATVQLHLLEAGVEFVRKAGGINEAQHILGVIRRIRSL